MTDVASSPPAASGGSGASAWSEPTSGTSSRLPARSSRDGELDPAVAAAAAAAAERTAAAKATAAKPVDRMSPAELEAQITATRARLAGTVDEIADRVNPKNVAARTSDRVRTKVVDFFTLPDGELDRRKVGLVAGGVVLVVTLRVIAARRTRHSS